jgi:hypothetical protein
MTNTDEIHPANRPKGEVVYQELLNLRGMPEELVTDWYRDVESEETFAAFVDDGLDSFLDDQNLLSSDWLYGLAFYAEVREALVRGGATMKARQ